jgi:hypothetical protein
MGQQVAPYESALPDLDDEKLQYGRSSPDFSPRQSTREPPAFLSLFEDRLRRGEPTRLPADP